MSDALHREPSLEEEVQRVLRAGEQAKQATENEVDEWTDNTASESRAAVEEVKDKIRHASDHVADATDQASDTLSQQTKRARKGIYDVIDTAKDKAADATQAASAFADQVKDQAQEVANNVSNTDTSEVADTVKQKASEVGSQIADRTDVALSATGERIENFAGTVRANAPSGKAGDIATKAADAIEHSGQYLQNTDTSTLISDLTDLVRRRPIPSLLVALGIGYLVVRATRNSSY